MHERKAAASAALLQKHSLIEYLSLHVVCRVGASNVTVADCR